MERGLIHQHFGARLPVSVIPNGVEIGELASARAASDSHESLRILSVGRLAAYKQADRTLHALGYLPPAVELTIVGQGPLAPELRRLAHTLGVAARVWLPGQISREELIAQYGYADVAVSLSRHEAFGLAVLEAMVAGSPVVASDIPAHREVAGYAPHGRVTLVSPDCHPSDLAVAIQAAASAGRVADIEGWPLPTWTQCVAATELSYAEALASRGFGAVLRTTA